MGVFKRTDGRWVAAVELTPDPVTGKRRKKTSTARTRSAANKLHAEMLRSDLLVIESDLTVEQLLSLWFSSARRNYKQSTIRITQSFLLRINEQLGPIRLAKLTPARIDLFFTELESGGMKGSSAQRIWDVLHPALEYAVNMELIARSPMTRVRKPRRASGPVQAPTPEVVEQLFIAASGDLDMILQLRFACLGLRRGETCAMQWRDIDLEGDRLIVRHSVTHGERYAIVDGPTKKENERSVPLINDSLDLFRRASTEAKKFGLAIGRPMQPSDYVLSPTRDDKPLKPNAYTTRFARTRKRAGLDVSFRSHFLRHFAASEMLAGGVPPIAAGEILGISVEVLLGTYGHFIRGSEEAIATLEEKLPSIR